MSKKILFLADASNIHTIRWAKKALEWGYAVTVCSMTDDSIPGVTVIYWRRKLAFAGKLDYILFYFTLVKLLKNETFDIIHAHYASSYGFIGALAKPKNFIVSVWGSDIFIFPKRSFAHRVVINFTLQNATIICSTSKAMATEISKYTKKRIYLTPFGVNTDEYIPSQKNTSKMETIVIGTIKRLEDVYGIDILIKAFEILMKRNMTTIQLVVAGTGSQEKKLQSYAKGLGVENHVNFVGLIPQSEVRNLLGTFDLFVALSRSESFGVAVLEASSCQLPVVTTDVGGLPEVVIPGQTGLLVPTEDPIEAANALEKLIRDPELRSNFGKEGRKFVCANYEWDIVSEKMNEIYKFLSN